MHDYEINLSRHGTHYAKVILPKWSTAADALIAHAEFGRRFMPSEGWGVTLMCWTVPVGETMAEQR